MKIKLHPDHSKQIAEELHVTKQTVHTATHYFNNSLKAQAIRRRAKELLHAEADKVIVEYKNE
ncbi:MAG: hypothetical protein ACI7YS_14550 [Flavobacterium sp.]